MDKLSPNKNCVTKYASAIASNITSTCAWITRLGYIILEKFIAFKL